MPPDLVRAGGGALRRKPGKIPGIGPRVLSPRREAIDFVSPSTETKEGSIEIEIWSDVVCPWCYIGKRRFEAALAGFDGHVEVRWRSFELEPRAPRAPRASLDEELAVKYGITVEEAGEMMAHMARTAAEEGLELNFDRARRGNTFDAHRLLHFAADRGAQPEMKERLLRAYMTEGRPIAQREELARLAGEVGLDPEEVGEMLATDCFVEDVRRDEVRARELGIRGVPFFLVEGRIGVSGAQPAEVLRDALAQASDRAS